MKIRDIRTDIMGNPPGVCIIYGDEPFFLDHIENAVKEHPLLLMPEMNLTVFEGNDSDPEEIEKVARTYPFGCERRFVLVKNPTFLLSKGKGESKSEESAGDEESVDWEEKSSEEKPSATGDMGIFLDLIETLPDTTSLIVLLNSVPDKRKKYLTEIRKRGKVYDIERLSHAEMGKWVTKLLKDEGKQIGPAEIDYFIDLTGYFDRGSEKNMYDIENLTKKLISFAGDRKLIERDMLVGIAPRNLELDIFKMVDTLSVGNLSHGMRIYEDMLKDGESPMRILSTIVSQIRSALICGMAEANHESLDRMKKKIGSNSDYYVKMNLKRAKALGYKKLTAGLNRCLEAEYNIKSGRMHDRLAMEMLFVRLFEA